MSIRVLVTGGRNYMDRSRVFVELNRRHTLLPTGGISHIIHGGGRGADQFAKEWAIYSDVPHMEFRADWQKYGRSAGPMRNGQMLAEAKPDLVVAFPGGRGTADMVRQARVAKIRVVEVK